MLIIIGVVAAILSERIDSSQKKVRKLNRELEERVKKRTSELEAVNKELNDFAYVVSHDLKAPLRAINKLSVWIKEDYSDILDDDGREKIDLINSRVKRMDGFINGILQYSRVGRSKEINEEVNLKILVTDVLEAIDPPKNINIKIDNELPVIIGDWTRFRQVFQNLLSNAVKFMDKPEGEIRIGCHDDGKCWKFIIADNGPGIDEKYHNKVFQIFQTLTPRDEHENTGIGLTLVKKIIELYGGEIWIESETGSGSKFYFTLPKNKGGE